MTTDWKALCAELAETLAEEYGVQRELDSGDPLLGSGAIELLSRARTALDQPEPPSRLRHCPTHGQQPENAWGCPECVREMRQQLAQPEPEGPTDQEMNELFWKHSFEIGPSLGVGLAHEDAPALICEALARWGRPAVEPESNGQT